MKFEYVVVAILTPLTNSALPLSFTITLLLLRSLPSLSLNRSLSCTLSSPSTSPFFPLCLTPFGRPRLDRDDQGFKHFRMTMRGREELLVTIANEITVSLTSIALNLSHFSTLEPFHTPPCVAFHPQHHTPFASPAGSWGTPKALPRNQCVSECRLRARLCINTQTLARADALVSSMH